MTIERDNWYETPLAVLAWAGWAGLFAGAVGLVVYAPLVWNLGKLVYWFS